MFLSEWGWWCPKLAVWSVVHHDGQRWWGGCRDGHGCRDGRGCRGCVVMMVVVIEVGDGGGGDGSKTRSPFVLPGLMELVVVELYKCSGPRMEVAELLMQPLTLIILW